MRITPALAALALAATTAGVATSAPAGAAPEPASREDAVTALTSHPALARGAAGQTYRVGPEIVDADGTTHVRMDRRYKGLDVVGGDLVVHQDASGDLESVSQSLRKTLDLDTNPSVARGRARIASLATKVARTIKNLKLQGTPDLVVDATGVAPVLAWRVVSGGTQADGTPSRLATYVDATSGKVLRAEQEIVNVDGEGHSLYSGAVPLGVSKSGSGYTLTDPDHGSAATTDMKNKEDSFLCTLLGLGCANGSVFSSPDPSFGNGNDSNRESAAVDASYGAAMTWNYFKGIHGRDGIFGDGTGAPSRVHYGSGYANAFWDGEKMTYGDGDGTEFGPLVSLDVAGHEMSHGVTEHTAGLNYSGESGGLNESTSDIFGTMVEFYADNSSDPGDYYIGEQFDLANHAGFRRMDKPSSDGSSQDCWTSGTKDLDVHYSSGVGNHFFYLLAEGSGARVIGGKSHNSPTCDGSTITGVGRAGAAKIWFRALDAYMTSGTTYAQARTYTLDAAKDIYGQDSTQYGTVAAAWSAVGVN
ncbi:MAG: M4 family metallopeptidase [Nocardioides sp.]|nr:M4 family metallopeptidase [Nocardioides sp.]